MPSDVDPGRRLLVDTMVVSWLGGRKGPFLAWQEVVRDRDLFISFATYAEVIEGGRRAGWGDRTLDEWRSRLHGYTVIPGTVAIAESFALLSSRFRDQMSEADLWIAATALGQPEPLPLGTADRGFEKIAPDFPLVIVRPGGAAP